MAYYNAFHGLNVDYSIRCAGGLSSVDRDFVPRALKRRNGFRFSVMGLMMSKFGRASCPWNSRNLKLKIECSTSSLSDAGKRTRTLGELRTPRCLRRMMNDDVPLPTTKKT